MGDIALKVNGATYAGWKRMRVVRSMESLAGSFELEVSDKWGSSDLPWPIVEEDECQVLVDGVVVLTGYVDARTPSFDASGHSLNVTGRDRAGALVDCSAQLDKWSFKNLSLLQLAQNLCKPFGISVALDPAVSAATVTLKTGKRGALSGSGAPGKRSGLKLPASFSKFVVSPGESAFEVLDRACRAAGVVPISDGSGGVLLTRAGSGARASTALEQGVNILGASATFDASAMYRTYTVLGQQPGTDLIYGNAAARVKASVADVNVKRLERELIMRPTGAVNQELALNRASWEMGVRSARGVSCSVGVQSWTQADGSLWQVNALVPIKSTWLGVDGDMLITQVEFNADDSSGTTTTLSLKPPRAFNAEPVASSDAGPSGWVELKRGVTL